jgi:hypothetical protein
MGDQQAKKACSFLKKTKKLLRVWARCSRKDRSQTNKSFLLLFFKTEVRSFSHSGRPSYP